MRFYPNNQNYAKLCKLISAKRKIVCSREFVHCLIGHKNKKTLWNGGPENIFRDKRLFLFCLAFEVFCILGFELINTTSGINKFQLPCKEWMRSMRNLKLN